MSRGIILIALGHANYGNMARNLAISLKHSLPNIPITLVHNNSSISHLDQQEELFNFIECPAEYYDKGFVQVKTHLYDLSPYSQTLYLDVDMIWLNGNRSKTIFNELISTDFAVSNGGIFNDDVWAKLEDVKETYKFSGDYYKYFSEFIWFKKTDRMKAYFERAKEIFRNPQIKTTDFANGSMADELAFQIAGAELEVYPHQANYFPLMWHFRDKEKLNLQTYQLQKEFAGMSIGGNFTPPNVKLKYDNLVQWYFQQKGIRHPFRLKDKRSYLHERQKI